MMTSSPVSPPQNVSDIGLFLSDMDTTEASTIGTTLTTVPTHADTTLIEVVTTALPMQTDSTVIAVVIVLVLLTVLGLAFLLYRYLCHNKGDYRTTGELAPGEDPDEDSKDQATVEKKEYFI